MASRPSLVACPGFSLLEVLAALALVAALAALAAGLASSTRARAARLRAEGELAVIATALEAYQRHFGAYPAGDEPAHLLASLSGRRGPTGAGADGPDFLGGTLARTEGRDPELLDPWGASYRYVAFVLPDGGYRLWSRGPDGKDQRDPAGRLDPNHPVNRDNVGPAGP